MFVPADFDAPQGLVTESFVLEPLGPEHNEDDYEAWSTSMEHIHASPGLGDWSWPKPMTLDENLRDLEMHARHFAERSGFTYTVLDPQTRRVIGCVYIYPAKGGATRADLDEPPRRTVHDWLARAWPFERVEYALRGGS